MTSGKPVRPGPGSFRLLSWLARLGVCGIEPVRLVLGISQAAVYSHISRLQRAGMLWRVQGGDGQGAVIVLTPAGAREVRARHGAAVVSARTVAPSSARHGRAASWVAASLDLRGLDWLGPRELRCESGWRAQRDDGALHTPDLGLVHADGRRTAVEVELQPKSNERLAQILGGYRALIASGQLTDVSYVTDRGDVSDLVRRQAARAGVSPQLHIGPLEKIITAARARANDGALRTSIHAASAADREGREPGVVIPGTR
jgi:DNA-binding MarR family transcriptional regulator